MNCIQKFNETFGWPDELKLTDLDLMRAASAWAEKEGVPVLSIDSDDACSGIMLLLADARVVRCVILSQYRAPFVFDLTPSELCALASASRKLNFAQLGAQKDF